MSLCTRQPPTKQRTEGKGVREGGWGWWKREEGGWGWWKREEGGWGVGEGEEEAVLNMSVLMIDNSFPPPSVGLEGLSRPTPCMVIASALDI